MHSTSTIQLSKSALMHNLRFIQSLIGDGVIFSSVVKGNAYGHGIEKIVPILESCQVTSFAVFSSYEAVRVKNALKGNQTIIIFGYIPDEDLNWVVENEIECYISDSQRAAKLVNASIETNKKAIVHIDLETGMNRTGLNQYDLQKAISVLKQNKENFHIRGICTHFAGAESISNHVRVQNQFALFKELVAYLGSEGIVPDILHAASSAAAITYPETRLDMVRIGILQYGFWPSQETFIHYIHDKSNKQDPLRRILRWKSKTMDVKTVKQGEFIGYGNFFQANKDMKIAIIPIGYYDGYSRSLSNQGKVLINNQRVSVIGMVNMNMIICDITKLPNADIGDEVVMIGKQGKNELSVASFSELSNLVNYELLTRLPHTINRIQIK
ncbi:MAG: alanine racemase [Bacteroidales bacterium]|nr:alanine racemase [Bacteroidales bacterium]